MNVLSLFDGMSCGQQALERCGVSVDNYFASEIDKYAIQVTMANYPNTKQLGSVTGVNGLDLPKIDLLIGGSPCQSFSFAGKRKGMSTKDEVEILTLEHYLQLKADDYEFEGQSYLFWEYMRLLNEVKPKYFLLENVMMGEKWEKVLTKAIGVNPIEINSALVSAQNRRRLYWTNIGLKPGGLFGDLESIIQQPKDKGILLKDILESEVNEKYFLSEKMLKSLTTDKDLGNGIWKSMIPKEFDEKSSTLTARLAKMGKSDNYIKIDKKGNIKENQNKASCFTAGGNSGGNHSDMDLICVAMRGRNPENPKSRVAGLPTEQKIEPRNDGKTNCLTSVQKDNLVMLNDRQKANFKNGDEKANTFLSTSWKGSQANGMTLVKGCDYRTDEGFRIRENGKSGTLAARARNDESCGQLAKINSKIRRLTPIECERLQTVKDNYTNYVSDSQRYKMLGNGWTVDVIAHVFSYLD
jgi:DNA (cytosine-5)-methyltransferase 3A